LRACLHLKTAVCALGDDTLLLNPAWLDAAFVDEVRASPRIRVIEVDPREPFAANAFALGGRVVHSASFPRTRARLESSGLTVASVAASELAKAEGGVTCCSLIVSDRARGR
jgi:dimethylargininase